MTIYEVYEIVLLVIKYKKCPNIFLKHFCTDALTKHIINFDYIDFDTEEQLRNWLLSIENENKTNFF